MRNFTLYENTIATLLKTQLKKQYDNEIKIAIGKFEKNEIFVTEFLYAKIQSLLERHHGHKEIDDSYMKLLPYIFMYYDEIIEDIRNGRTIISIFDSEGRRIFHIIDEHYCLVSIFIMRRETFVRSKKYIIKSVREGGVSSILSPAMPFWRHTDLIEQLYQKLKRNSLKIKSYLITDPLLYGHDAVTLKERLENVIQRYPVDFVCFRDKTTPLYAQLAKVFIQKSRECSAAKVLLHGDFSLAHALKADGVHLTSTQFDSLKEAKAMGLYVIISTHTHDEALKAQELGADAIAYSPIFASPNKGNPKGLEDLKAIVDKMSIPIFALGGIVSHEQINAVEASGAYGFASIRYFV